MIVAMARAPVSSAATAINPCGASVAVSIATKMATAAGASRRSAIARSTSTQVTITPERDQRLGAQAVVERQPGGQEHRARGEHRHSGWPPGRPFRVPAAAAPNG